MINNLYIKATPAAASITWGSITGTLSSQTDLQNALDAKFDDPTGTVSQYVRGDGSLANFPASTGGGGSLSYYLNGSVAQGTFGGVAFKEMDRVPVLGAGTDFTIAANGYIQSFITDANVPNQLEIPAGNWNFETYFSANSNAGNPSFYIELYKWNGTTLSLIASNSATPEGITNGTSIHLYVSALAVPQTVLTVTDRLAIRIYVNNSGRTITLHTENSHLCQVITTFSTGLTALNGLTAQVQNFATGTAGTDFGISSATSTHTFNLPTASAANRGALSSADWTTFNNKQAALVSGTNIKTVNGTTLLGSGNLVVTGTQVGYRGFKYNIGTGTDFPSPTVPLAGQALLLFDDDNFAGMTISLIDADGLNTSELLYKINGQPITIVNANNSKTIVVPITQTFVGGANPYLHVVTNNYNYITEIGVAYIDFNTSNAIPAYNGYTMAGNLNGTSIAVGTSYLGIGSSTAGSTIDSRSFVVNTPQRVVNGTIRTAGIMTGSMSIRVINEATPLGTEFVLASGTAAGTYQFANYLVLPSSQSTLSLRIIQSTATSCGINSFSFILR
jgi:hypothetical protein